MKTQVVIIQQLVTGVVSGVLIALSFNQPTPVLASMLAGGIVLALVSLAWGCWKFGQLSKRLANWHSEPITARSTGFSDIDAVVNSLFATQQNDVTDESRELEEVKALLEKIDRRRLASDRDGNPRRSADRLVAILEGYGNRLTTNISQASSCGKELQRTIEEIVNNSEVQSDLMGRTTSVVENLSAHILSVCDDAELALGASEELKSKAQSGLEQFQAVAEEIKQVRKITTARDRKMQQLNEHTKEIESIVQTIGSLSSRTDLLALNASIESVRAGEHGRGFAIVAEEVRALAEQSAQAVADISRRLEMIQLETNQSSQASDDDPMQTVTNRINETLEALETICSTADSSTKGLGEISENTTKQLQLAQQIVEALEKSTDTTQQNRSRAEGANWTAKSLGEASEHLSSSLDLFTLAGAIEVGAEHG